MNKYSVNGINSEEELKIVCQAFRQTADNFDLYQEPMWMYAEFEKYINKANIKVNIPKKKYLEITSSILYYGWEGMAKPFKFTKEGIPTFCLACDWVETDYSEPILADKETGLLICPECKVPIN